MTYLIKQTFQQVIGDYEVIINFSQAFFISFKTFNIMLDLIQPNNSFLTNTKQFQNSFPIFPHSV
jgi:hypothetical protein